MRWAILLVLVFISGLFLGYYIAERQYMKPEDQIIEQIQEFEIPSYAKSYINENMTLKEIKQVINSYSQYPQVKYFLYEQIKYFCRK
jgi:steroid 5-alpha reductase family enzyme